MCSWVDDGVGVVRLTAPRERDRSAARPGLREAIREAADTDDVGALVVGRTEEISPPAPTSRPWPVGP
jgi:hypothetical protein